MRRIGRMAVVVCAPLVMLAGPSLVDANAGGVVTKCLTGDTSLCIVYSYDFRPEDRWGYLSVQSNGTELARYQCIPTRMGRRVVVTVAGTPTYFDDYAIAVGSEDSGLNTYSLGILPGTPLTDALANVCYGFAPVMNAIP